MDGRTCPCGLGEDYDSCCGRLHAGAPAPTAEALMRSRYSAFAIGDVGHLLRTWHPSGRPPSLTLDPSLQWTRLAVLETRDGGLFDATGMVRFRAMYLQDGRRGVLEETSRFVRQDGLWTYLGPQAPPATVRLSLLADDRHRPGVGVVLYSGLGYCGDRTPDVWSPKIPLRSHGRTRYISYGIGVG
jgi:SEC-C motif domain protein